MNSRLFEWASEHKKIEYEDEDEANSFDSNYSGA